MRTSVLGRILPFILNTTVLRLYNVFMMAIVLNPTVHLPINPILILSMSEAWFGSGKRSWYSCYHPVSAPQTNLPVNTAPAVSGADRVYPR